MKHPARPARIRVLAAGLALLLGACASLPPTQTVQLGGQRLAQLRVGQGPGPTLVLQSGLGDSHMTWAELIPLLSERHRVWTYDRPGYGDSPRASAPRDACTVARELHGTLQAAGVRPPYLLVGHSIGGLYQHAFARLYPQEVAGLVLLEPTHPEHWARLQQEAPGTAVLVRALRSSAFSGVMRDEFDAQTDCLDRLDRLDRLPPRGPDAPPAVLLRRSRFALAEQGAFAEMVARLWQDWGRLVALEGIEHLPGDDHYLQRSQPKRVAAAIDAMVARHCPRVVGEEAGAARCEGRD